MNGRLLQRKSFSSYVRWWVMGPCLVLIALGCLILALDIGESVKYFVAGALIGAGAGGAIAEWAATLERREDEERTAELREVVLAQCRLAYRLGEFAFGFYAAVSKGDPGSRELKEFLFLSELLGMRRSLELAIQDADLQDPDLHGYLIERVQMALMFLGHHLYAFFLLSQDLLAIRGDDAKTNVEARHIVQEKIQVDIDRLGSLTDDVPVGAAWKRLCCLWNEEELSSHEVDELLLAVHAYFLVLGVADMESRAWQEPVRHIAGLKDGADSKGDVEKIVRSIEQMH